MPVGDYTRTVLETLGLSAALDNVVSNEDDVKGVAGKVALGEAERLALRMANRNRTVSMPYATEAGRFQQAVIPTVVCGPGSIDQAHQPDEFITLAALSDGEAFLRRLIEACAA